MAPARGAAAAAAAAAPLLLVALAALALPPLAAAQPAQQAPAQGVETYVTDDVYPIGGGGEFQTMNIASVISNIWVGAFALTSVIFAVAGLAVAWQWPNPRCFCYRTPYSDLPNTGAGRSCCSLYTLNIGFLVAWMLLLAIMAVSRDVIRIAVCVSFVVLHAAAVGAFRFQFKRKGRPAYPEAEMSAMGGPSAAGVPMYHIPMSTATVGDPSPAGAPGTWGTYPPPPPPGGAGAGAGAGAAGAGGGAAGYPPAAGAGAAGAQQQQQHQQQQQFGGYASPYPYQGAYGAPASQAMPSLYGGPAGGGYPPVGGYPPAAGAAPASPWHFAPPAAAAAPAAAVPAAEGQAAAAAVGVPAQATAGDTGDALASQRR